jgi:hypothetical protein
MKMRQAYHHYTMVASLLVSAAGFKLASTALGWATRHRAKFNLLEDERITAIMGLKRSPIVHRSIVSKNQWMDAMPEECPLCGDAGTCIECTVSTTPYPEK